MVTKKGMEKDPELGKKIDSAIFPGLQGGPHNHQTAGIAVALAEAARPEFKDYALQIVKNAKVLADTLMQNGIDLFSGGTDNHLMLLDLSKYGGLGAQLEYAMDIAHMTANKNTIPGDTASPYYPSGLRIGTPAITTRGMKEPEMKQIASFIRRVADNIKNEEALAEIKTEVRELTSRFPLYSELG